MLKNRYLIIPLLFANGLLSACAPPDQPKLPTPKEAYGSKPVYNYPLDDPYAATVITVPPNLRVDYSSVPEAMDRKITLFPERQIPEGFWYQKGLDYSELLQKKPAPLVYIIPGTGANYHASVMHTIADILYTAGYSVVMLPSPTNPNFIVSASQNFLPGSPEQDASDLYRLIQAIDADVSKRTTITGHKLLGYSLGAWEAAYTARLDSQDHVFNFSKVLLINPPLSLYSSMQILDNDLVRAMPNGVNDADQFIKGIITRMTRVSANTEAFDFESSGLLVEYYNKYHPSDDRLATMIGLSFRLSAADMAFTSDVMRHGGYIFPKNQELTTSTSLNSYMAVALRTSFTDYLNDVFYQEQHEQNPSLSKQSLIDDSDLESLAPFIQNNDKLMLITNRDDVILAPGDLEKLEQLFGNRATVFPSGGHLGNIGLPAMSYQILDSIGPVTP